MKRKLPFLFALLAVLVSHSQVSDFKHINFNIADNVAKLNEGASLKNLPVLAHELTYKLSTDVEKFRAIYYWVSHNVIGDAQQEAKVNKSQRTFKNDSLGFVNWNHEYKRTAFKKLMKHKKTVCTGYAYLIKELCFLANIECEIVDGYGRNVNANVEALETINHSWNAVKLNGKWYLCDATWSSGYFLGSLFVKDYNDGYFLTDPQLFSKNHFPAHKKWLLDNPLSEKEFVSSPLIYSEAFKYKLIPNNPNEMNIETKKNDEVLFSFTTLDSLSNNKISLVKYIGTKEIPYKIYNIEETQGITTFRCKFDQKGFYDTHLKINNDIVATYTVKVTK